MLAAHSSFCCDTKNVSFQLGRVTCNEGWAIIPQWQIYGRAPLPLFWAKKEEITEGKMTSRARKSRPPPLAQGLDPPLFLNLRLNYYEAKIEMISAFSWKPAQPRFLKIKIKVWSF